MNPRNPQKTQSLAYISKSTRVGPNQRSPTGLVSKKNEDRSRNPNPPQEKYNLSPPQKQTEEGDSEFMAKLSELTGKLSSMDYVPKNKLLKKEFEKNDRNDFYEPNEAEKSENQTRGTQGSQIQQSKAKIEQPLKSQSLQQGVRRPAKSIKIPEPKISQNLQKDIAEDLELKKFMSKYET